MIGHRHLVFGVLMWIFSASCAGTMDSTPTTPTDTTVVTFERAVHFQSADGADVVAEPGKYRVEAMEETHLRLIPQPGESPLMVQALSSTHEVPVIGPVALAIPQGEDEQHVVLVLPGGKSLDAIGSFSGVRGRGAMIALPPSIVGQAAVQKMPDSAINLQDLCAVGRDPQPNVARWRPFGRVWPGGKIVFEGQGLDPSRFAAVIGSGPQRILLTLVSGSPSRIEAQVPIRPDGGPYTPSTGDRLAVSYKGTVGCKLLNPAFVIADAFTVQTHAAGLNRAYFWIRHQMDLKGEIEGVRTITIRNHTERSFRDRVSDVRGFCDWHELPPSGRTIILTDNRIHHSLFGFMMDHRTPPDSQSVTCKLPVSVVIQDPFTNTSQTEEFLVPMTIRNPKTVTVDSHKVIKTFQGVEPSLPPIGPSTGAMGDCGKLYAGDPRGNPQSTIGVTVQNDDWVFSIKSGVLPTICRYNSKPVEAELGVAFGPHIGWDVTNAGDRSKCHASPTLGANGTIGIVHRLESMQVYLSCDPGPLGDNGVTIRAKSMDLLVQYEYMPPIISREVQN